MAPKKRPRTAPQDARWGGAWDVVQVRARRPAGVIGGCPEPGCDSRKVKQKVTIAHCCKQAAQKAATKAEWKPYKQRLVQWENKNGDNWLDTWEPDNGECTVCESFHTNDDNVMLVCDGPGCNRPYHQHCLDPLLLTVPEGDWFCPACAPPQLEMMAYPQDEMENQEVDAAGGYSTP